MESAAKKIRCERRANGSTLLEEERVAVSGDQRLDRGDGAALHARRVAARARFEIDRRLLVAADRAAKLAMADA